MKSKILVIDDEVTILNQISSSVLSVTEIDISTAQNVKDAEKKILEEDFDLIVCDCNLDGVIVAGHELFNLMEKNFKTKSEEDKGKVLGQPYWIFMSGNPEILDDIKRVSGSTFISKPFEDDQISKVIETSIRVRSNKKMHKKIDSIKEESITARAEIKEDITSLFNIQSESKKVLDEIHVGLFKRSDNRLTESEWQEVELIRAKKAVVKNSYKIYHNPKFQIALATAIIGIIGTVIATSLK